MKKMTSKLPDYHNHVDDYIVWLGVAALRKPKTSMYYVDTDLYATNGSKRMLIGFVSAYMERAKSGEQEYNRPLFNLFLYKPNLDLFRLRLEEIYMQYLHISYDPYYLYTSYLPHPRNQDAGTILYQIIKRQKSLP